MAPNIKVIRITDRLGPFGDDTCNFIAVAECERAIYHLILGLEVRSMTHANIFEDGETVGWKLSFKRGREKPNPEKLPRMPCSVRLTMSHLMNSGYSALGDHFSLSVWDNSNADHAIFACEANGYTVLWRCACVSAVITLIKVKLVYSAERDLQRE